MRLYEEEKNTAAPYLLAWHRRFAERQAEAIALARQARADLPKAIELLKAHGAKRILLFGSLCRPGLFHRGSDIDLAVEGISSADFDRASADLMMAMDWLIDLKPWEKLEIFFRERILQTGEVLHVE